MIDYREGKTRYIPNELGSLYVNNKKISDNERPVIYIGGQMEHRCHVLEQCRDMVADAIISSLNQDYKSIEIILVDDGSTDNTFYKIINTCINLFNVVYYV